jgi:hypothetical protein
VLVVVDVINTFAHDDGGASLGSFRSRPGGIETHSPTRERPPRRWSSWTTSRDWPGAGEHRFRQPQHYVRAYCLAPEGQKHDDGVLVTGSTRATFCHPMGLTCAECGRESEHATGWRGDYPIDENPDVPTFVFYCPTCWERAIRDDYTSAE